MPRRAVTRAATRAITRPGAGWTRGTCSGTDGRLDRGGRGTQEDMQCMSV